MAREWWREAVIYQIYPRSFMDSDGDGIGDLAGALARLDHLAALGVDAVWLSPHFDSPNADNGYDIRDYRKVMAEFGTMAAFDALLAGLTARGIRLILDLVVNHTSDEHPWFIESRKSRDNPYRDYYIWRDGREGGGPPNNYPSFFGGSAWSEDPATGQWYLHYFGAKQPDLNWENPRVRAEVHDIMRFWLAKGVAGFRMDVIAMISKQPGLPDLDAAGLRAPEFVYTAGPRLHAWLREMRHEVGLPYVAIGEAFGVTPEGLLDLTAESRGELDLAFGFEISRIGRQRWRQGPWRLRDWKALFATADARAVAGGAWNCVWLENHDNPRAVSIFGDPDPDWRMASARVLAVLLMTQRGTAFLYQGQEIGMANHPFRDISEFRDIEAQGYWRAEVEGRGADPGVFLAELSVTARDNARTPMQWGPGPGAGFTAALPWMAVNPDHGTVNVAAQEADPGSVLACYRRLIRLRRETEDLRLGDYEDLAPEDDTLFAYRRGGHRIVLNMGREARTFALPEGGRLLFATDPAGVSVAGGLVHLAGWQAAIVAPPACERGEREA